MAFEVHVETSSGGRLGSGPITTATRLGVETRLDRIGACNFSMAATDPATALFPDNTARYVRARRMRNGTRVDVGRGIVRERRLNSETKIVDLSGPDLLDELTRTHVGRLELASGTSPIAAAAILPAIMAYALPGWTTSGTPSGGVYYKFGDESVFAALVKIAELLGDHFRLSLSVDRRIEWLPTTTEGFDAVASGIRAIDVGDPDELASNPDVCLIVGGLDVSTDDMQRITRIYPRGAGNADAQLFLNGTTRTAPTGFTLHIDADPAQSYIKWDDGEETANVFDPSQVISLTETFRDIAGLDASTAGDVSASNTLFDTALVRLRRSIKAQKAYRLQVTKLDRDLLVGQTIYVKLKHFNDDYKWIDEGRELMVLSVSPSIDMSTGEVLYNLEVTA